MILLFIIVSGVLLLLIVIGFYNGFIHRRNNVKRAFSTIDVQLKKRWDLIPGLVETAKSYAEHERGLFESIIEKRNQLKEKRADLRGRLSEEQSLSVGVSKMIALSESYPDLKSDKIFLRLQRDLTEVEAQIAAARRAYNSAVLSWNSGVQMFPGSLFASAFGFKEADWFEMPEVERVNPKVDFSS